LLALALMLLTMPIGLASRSLLSVVLAVVPANLFCAAALTATSERVVALSHPQTRGWALGWHSTAITAGTVAGSLLAGQTIDQAGPGYGYLVAGSVGAGIVLIVRAAPTARRGNRRNKNRKGSYV
jgi:predicted MFS family arabinose efflux permease